MGAGAPSADGRSRARGHLRRVRGTRRRHYPAAGRPPPGRSTPLRMGVQCLPAGEPGWDRGGRDTGRPRATGRPMLAGLALFALGLVIGGTAPDMAVLVAGRAVQGLGAGVVPAVAYVAISRCYPEESRPRMFAVLSTAWVVPGLVGPGIAALVATAVGWRWVFLGLLPLVIAAGALVVLALRNVPPPASPGTATVPYLAVLGVVAGAGTALASLNSGVVPVAAVGGIAGGILLAASLRQLTPPKNLSARPGLTATIFSRSLLTCCFFAGDAYVP